MRLQGIIDLHTHGMGRHDTSTDNHEEILAMARLHQEAGTAYMVPTIYSGPIDRMRRNLQAVKLAMEIQQKSDSRSLGAGILGVHLEGPFLNPARCGSLPKESFIRPALSALNRLIEGFEAIIRIITIAPELPGALRVIERCSDFGIRVNMGHSDATLRQALEAKKAGATGITHIFNAMRPLHHREPGLAGLGLTDRDLYIEVIADAVHLHPQIIGMIFKCKSPDRIILVSDSVKGKKSAKSVVCNNGILAGSGLSIGQSIERLRNIGLSDRTVLKASRENPLRYIGA